MVSRLSPRHQRSKEARDEYDGHADYRETFAPKPARVIARSFLRVLLAVGLCVSITWAVHKLLYPGPNIVVLFTAGFAGLLGLLGGAFGYSWMNEDRSGEQKELGALDTIAVLVIGFVFVIPVSIERSNEKRERRARAAEHRAAEWAHGDAVARRQADGSADRMAAGSRGRPDPSPDPIGAQSDGSPDGATLAPRDGVEAPTNASAVSAAEPVRPPAILKCRDASGAFQYTQAYCPAGTVQVKERTRD